MAPTTCPVAQLARAAADAQRKFFFFELNNTGLARASEAQVTALERAASSLNSQSAEGAAYQVLVAHAVLDTLKVNLAAGDDVSGLFAQVEGLLAGAIVGLREFEHQPLMDFYLGPQFDVRAAA